MPSRVTRELPASVQEIADVIGREAALRLVGALPPCGARPWRRFLYVPRTLTDDHVLVRVLGRVLARKMVYHFRDCILEPSACRHIVSAAEHEAIRAANDNGQSITELAVAFGLSTRHVRRVIAGNPGGRSVDAPPEARAHANDNEVGQRRTPK